MKNQLQLMLLAFKDMCLSKPKAFTLLVFLIQLSIVSASPNATNLNDDDLVYSVTGVVTDSQDGSRLIGVNILIKGGTTGTATDIDGNYTIDVPDRNTVLVFSYTGYNSKEIIVEDRTVIDVELSVNSAQLEEVVVVGYGNQDRAKVTGAIATVDAKAITEVPVFTADQALQGRAAGVYVSNNGSPGADPVVRIRGLGTTGDNSPLIVVDGVIVQGLGDVNPNDIESITVLKDASTTAVFGAQGSNGVIVVKTKGGTSGETKIELSSYIGTQQVAKRFDVMNREQYLQHAENWGVAQGRIGDPQYADLINNDTDWQDEIFRDGLMQSHNIAVSGGTENSTFRVGAGYISQEGVMLNTATDRYNFRANATFKKDKLTFGENLAISLVDRTPENTAGGRSAIEHAIKMPPYFAVFNPDNIGGYQGVNNSLDAQDAENPVRVLAHPQQNQSRTNLLGNIFAEYEIIEGLSVRGQVGLDWWSFNNDNFTPSFSGEPTAVAFAVIGKGNGTHQQVTTFGQLNYTKSFGSHNINALLLAEYNNSYDTRAGASSTNAVTDEISNLTNQDAQIGSFKYEYTRIGYLGRINYDWAGKYILAGSYRRDASSRFGPNNRWAGFYSVAGGWVVSKEDFFPQDGLINFLKLRGSIGTVGNDRIGEYRYAASINTGSYNTSFVDILTGSTYLGAGTTAGNVAVPDLRWETTTMTNIGVDMYLLDNRFSFAAEYYKNRSDDLLINVRLTPSLGGHNGFGPRNVGAVETDGFEFNFGYNDREGDFQWSANLNLSTTNNVVKDLNGEVLSDGGFEGANLLRSVEEESLNHFFGFVTLGLFQDGEEILTSPLQEGAKPGDFKFADLSGPEGIPDGVIDDLDKTIIGNPIPDITYGFTLNASYKNFDANIFINGMEGNEIYNTNIWDLEGGRRFFNAGPQALDAWTPNNRDTDIPRITTDPQNLLPSDRFIEDGSFMRLKNITLGYTLPKIGRDRKSSIRFYLSGQNLLTITDYSGLDPEVGASALVGNNGSQVGIDRGNYPLSKTFIGGLQIKF